MNDELDEADVIEAFWQIAGPLESPGSSRVPVRTAIECELMAFDLEERHRLALSRAWLKTPAGEELLEALRESAKERPTRPLGEASLEDTRAKKKPRRKRKRSVGARPELPTESTPREPTAKQQEMADRFHALEEELRRRPKKS